MLNDMENTIQMLLTTKEGKTKKLKQEEALTREEKINKIS
jgi:hypothetical protein